MTRRKRLKEKAKRLENTKKLAKEIVRQIRISPIVIDRSFIDDAINGGLDKTNGK